MSKDFTDVGEAMISVLKKQTKRGFMRESGTCPACGQPLYVFMTGDRTAAVCKPACPSCGYRAVDGDVATNESEARKWTNKAHKSDALRYLEKSSMVSDHSIFSKTLANFEVKTDKQREAASLARKTAADIVAGEPAHCMLTGATGTGKSHLAMAILYQVLLGSEYTKRCAFIDFRELLDQTKRGFNDKEAYKFADMVTEEIKKADVVVIDDLGSEAGDINSGYNPSAWNVHIATSIFAARENRPTIVTTNLVGVDLKAVYGGRVISRISHHLDGRVMQFEGMDDYRVVAAS